MESILKNKSFEFAVRIIKLCRYLQKEKNEYVLNKQLLRAGTAIGALINEAEFAQSKADFISKMSIALKEANETMYWLKLLYSCEILDEKLSYSLQSDCQQIIALLVASIKTCKKAQKNQGPT